MELSSPLSQQARPDVFKPKVVGLYEKVFNDEHFEHSEGFWRELLLLRPDQIALKRILIDLSPDALLHHEIPTQELFERATEQIQEGKDPFDENALDTLTVFLETVLTKRYANPSSDVITVLSDLEGADVALTGFVAALDTIIRNGRTLDVRRKAVRAAIAAVAGAYHTGLVSYFINRDLFPSLMKLVEDAEDLFRLFAPCALLGLLANYNKFEFQNPYQLRLQDFVNDNTIRKIGKGIGATLQEGRDGYLAIQDDVPEGWDLTNTLSYIGLGRLVRPSKPASREMTPDEAKAAYAVLPSPEASVLLATYDFVNANKLFCIAFVTPETREKEASAPVDGFLSLSSYLTQNAYRTSRATHYSYACLAILRLFVEDHVVMKSICDSDNSSLVRLCRHSQPLLPLIQSPRHRIHFVLDVLVDSLTHNLKRRLDMELYSLILMPLLRIVSYLSRSRTRIAHHWTSVWQALFSLMKFLTTYTEHLKAFPGIEKLADLLIDVLALSLTSGENFLPDPKSYDDLFYKVLESSDVLERFKQNYTLAKRSSAGGIDILTSVSSHYEKLLVKKKEKGNDALSPREVTKVIKEGYDTLSIQSREGLDQWEKYREADNRNLVKRITRVAVQDMRTLLAERTP